MTQSESIVNFAKSFCEAQSKIPTLPKDKKGYGYNYTDLDTVIKTVRPILASSGLAVMQSLTDLADGKKGLTTRIFHSSGEYVEDTVTLPSVQMAKINEAQQEGAAITYIRRYMLCSMLGISSDEDVDGADIKQPQTPAKQQQPAKQQKSNAGAEIANILASVYPDGTQVFNEDDKTVYRGIYSTNGAELALKKAKAELSRRLSEFN